MDTTWDGNIVLALGTNSVNDDIKCRSDTAHSDCWVICVNKRDSILWQGCYGGSDNEGPLDIHLTKDHGFIVIGATFSNDGDIKDFHGNEDFWVLKLDSVGNLQWSRCYGGSGQDIGQSIKPTSDGGYIMTGPSNSSDGDVPPHNGSTLGFDFLVIKIDSVGNIQWSKSYGGTGDDYPYSAIEFTPRKYLITGQTSSFDGELAKVKEYGNYDVWLLMLDSIGNIQWQKCYGGSYSDGGRDLIKTFDGNIVCLGWTTSSDGDVTKNYGGSDYWIIKIDTLGNLLWQESLGGAGNELSYKITQTPDSGLVAMGSSYNSDSTGTGLVSGNNGESDFWIIATDMDGNYRWNKNMGSSRWDVCLGGMYYNYEIYCIGSANAADHDVTLHYGNDEFTDDGWLCKLSTPSGFGAIRQFQSPFTVFPNPTSDKLFIASDSDFTVTINIADLLGRSLFSQLLIFQSERAEINVRGLSAGIYFLTIKNGTNITTVRKFVKN